MSDFTENERIREWLDSHMQEFLDYFSAQSKDASQIEQVGFDSDRHTGMLVVYSWQGVTKIVQVTPQSLLEGFNGLEEEIRNLCINAANRANTAASVAEDKGDYAKAQGDKVALVITDLTTLKQQVAAQGDTAESQGLYALQQAAICKGISDYPPVWHEGFLWVYDKDANDPVMGKRIKTTITAVDFSTLSEETRTAMMQEFIRSNNAPSIVGSTLVFPDVSTARIENSTLIL